MEVQLPLAAVDVAVVVVVVVVEGEVGPGLVAGLGDDPEVLTALEKEESQTS